MRFDDRNKHIAVSQVSKTIIIASIVVVSTVYIVVDIVIIVTIVMPTCKQYAVYVE